MIWALLTNSYCWHTYLDRYERVCWERRVSGRIGLLYVGEMDVSGTGAPLSVCERDLEGDVGQVTKTKHGCTKHFRRCMVQKN